MVREEGVRPRVLVQLKIAIAIEGSKKTASRTNTPLKSEHLRENVSS